jgi:hypothetical protein
MIVHAKNPRKKTPEKSSKRKSTKSAGPDSSHAVRRRVAKSVLRGVALASVEEHCNAPDAAQDAS